LCAMVSIILGKYLRVWLVEADAAWCWFYVNSKRLIYTKEYTYSSCRPDADRSIVEPALWDLIC
ncbi:hypothetical protein U1Q18_052350, partial [Sarracenia purpurea var. burkii]